MKKVIIILAVIFLLLAPILIWAQDDMSMNKVLGEVATGTGYTEVNQDSLTLTIANLLRIFFSVLGVIFVAIIVYGGFQWMTAGGNEEQVGKAKKLIFNAVIGLAIVVLAFSITYFVGWALSTSTSTDNPWYYE
jgi:cytochrome bd-type quinol oxidase subunit 2